MAAWDNYATKATPADSDTMMIKDNAATGKPNKRVLFSGLWTWIVSKLSGATISALNTNPKTVTGGMNALQTAVTDLNSKCAGIAYTYRVEAGAHYTINLTKEVSNYSWITMIGTPSNSPGIVCFFVREASGVTVYDPKGNNTTVQSASVSSDGKTVTIVFNNYYSTGIIFTNYKIIDISYS